MFCFAPKATPVPAGDPETWAPKDVKNWLKSKGLDKYKSSFQNKSGKDLMEMKQVEVNKICAGKGGNQAVAEALDELKFTWAKTMPVQVPELVPAVTMSPSKMPKALEVSGLDSVRDSDQTPRTKTKGSILSDTIKAPELSPLKPMSANLLGPMDFADTLKIYTNETLAEPVCDYLNSIGKVGLGISDGGDAVGQVFGTAYQLHTTAAAVLVNKDNCSKLDLLGKDVVRCLDAAVKRQAHLSAVMLDVVAEQLQEAASMSEVFTKEGWMMHVVCNEKMKEEFDTIHNTVVDTLKAEGLETAGKPLARADYRDITKAPRRLLKQYGNGSVTEGIAKIGCDELSPAVRELARLVEVTPAEAARELLAVPTSELNVDTVYTSFMHGPAGSKDAMYVNIFKWYDKDASEAIDASELRLVLSDLGLLEGRKPAEADAFIANQLKMADVDGDGRLSFPEFCRFYDTLATSGARQMLRIKLGVQAEDDLRQLFFAFSSFGSRQVVDEMDNVHFSKLARECGLLGKDLTATDVDIFFTKAKPKGGRKVNFEQFLAAVAMCSDKKGVPLDATVRTILAVGGPVAHATKADAVRLHDDKSTYTGVYAKGGPKTVDPKADLATMLDRSQMEPKMARTPPNMPRGSSGGGTRPSPSYMLEGVKKVPSQQVTPPHQSRMAMSGIWTQEIQKQSVTWARRSSAGGAAPSVEAGQQELFEMFNAFATFGAGNGMGSTPTKAVEMDGFHFIKLCRDCRLLDKTFTSTSADLAFTRTKTKGLNKINFQGFMSALALIAQEKGVPVEQVHQAVTSSAGPLLTPSRG